MTPKKPKELIPVIAERLNQSPTLVGDIVDFFYGEVKKSLSSFENTHIQVSGLGIFITRPKMMTQKLIDYRRVLERLKPESNMQHYQMKKEIEKRIETIQCNLDKWQELFQQKKQVRQKRYESEEDLG